MKFQKGNKFGKGRPPKLKTQVKDFIKEHPYAVETLMTTLYEMGIEKDREAAMYIIDRIKGKPKAITGMDAEDREALNAATLVKLFQMMDEHRKLEQTPQRLLNYGVTDTKEGSQEDATD